MEDTKVLLLDNDKEARDFISVNLKNEGYAVFIASDGKIAINKARQISPQLIILDVIIPEMDGIEICKELRALPECSNSRIMFLTSRTEDYTQIAALDAGADDYILKPIRPRVLISRVKALMRRNHQINKDSVTIGGNVIIDRTSRSVKIGNKEVVLSKKEFDLLELLASKPGKVYSRHAIHEIIWNGDLDIDDRIIDVHVWKLRQKLGKDRIRTLKGIGYKMEF
jgi:two-component system alkaline phosphatase synthesis response regulator PhoP